MGSNATHQIQGAVERRSTRASTSKDRKDTERINSQTIARTKRRLLTKPAKRTLDAEAAAAPTNEEVSAKPSRGKVPKQPIVVGEPEGEPSSTKPGKPAGAREHRSSRGNPRPSPPAPVAVPEAQEPAPSDANHPAAAAPSEEPSNVPELPPDGIHRPCVLQLQETLFALDDICKQDGQIQVQVDEIGRLLAVIRRKESEIIQKVRDVQRTRVTVERLYMPRVKLGHSPPVVGLGEREVAVQVAGVEDGTRRKSPANKKRLADSEELDESQVQEEAGRLSPKRVRA